MEGETKGQEGEGAEGLWEGGGGAKRGREGEGRGKRERCIYRGERGSNLIGGVDVGTEGVIREGEVAEVTLG